MSAYLSSIQTKKFILVLFMIFFLQVGCKRELTSEVAEPETESAFECDSCPTFELGADTLEFVNEVRRFVATIADDGLLQNSLCDSFPIFAVEEFPVSRYLDLFERDLGRATCGLASRLMAKILIENGIDAYTYSFGFEDVELAHQVVLYKMGNNLFITDPYLNYTLYDELGAPMSIFSLIEQVGQRRLNLTTSRDSVEADMLIDYTLASEGVLKMLRSAGCTSFIRSKTLVRDSVYKIRFDRCFSCAVNRTCNRFIGRFENELISRTDFKQFHEGYVLKTKPVWGAPDYQKMDDLIQTALYSQPELGKRIRSRLR
jgi:hypothetical protein